MMTPIQQAPCQLCVAPSRLRYSGIATVCAVLLFAGCASESDSGPDTSTAEEVLRSEPHEKHGEENSAEEPQVEDRETVELTTDSDTRHAFPLSDTSESPTPVTTVDPDPETVVSAAGSAPPSGETILLQDRLDGLQVPPAWLTDVELSWDVQAKPWKEGRGEIRRLLGTNNEASRRQGIRMTWDYLQKKDIGDGHEYGMYMYLGGEPVWAVHAYREWIPKQTEYFPVFAWRALAALYTEFGEFDLARQTLDAALKEAPKHEMPIMRKAELNDSYGDLYVAWGKDDLAKKHYSEAETLYPQSQPKYGRHLLPRKAKKVRAKLEALSLGSLTDEQLKDGRFRETALGYSGDIILQVSVDNGKVMKIEIEHQEKIDQNACVLIPRRIVDAQSLKVDGISGATVTKDAIISGTLSALKKAGL